MPPSHPAAMNLPGWPGDVEYGSALDFSDLLDGPAGKYGRLVVENGKFVFEKARNAPVRFYGINLSSKANFLEKEACRRLADRLAACGYNSVRIHHHDGQLTLTTGDRATELDPVEMDKLDYLFHCCKERGIYLTTDLYVSRIPRQIFQELGRPCQHFEEFKFLIHLSDEVRKNWTDFSRNFLNHVNPYTGLAWKDDPALVTLSLVNEDAIYHCDKNANPDIRAIFDKHFSAWLQSRSLKPESTERRTALRNLFLYETCRDSLAEMHGVLRDIGCRTLLTAQNHWSIIPMSLLRQPFDFVDDHFYWDHPEHFPLPSRLLNTSSLSDLSQIFSGIFPGRCFGKPYTISEFNWVYPNQFRAESGPITAAYASLQDWDGLYRYTFSHSAASIEGTHPGGYFDIAADPINSLADRIGMLLFLRGDVSSSRAKIPFAVSSEHMHQTYPVNTYPGQAWKLGFVSQIGTVVERDGRLELPPEAHACIGVGDELKLRTEDSSSPVFSNEEEEARRERLQKLCDMGQGDLDFRGGIIRSSTGELLLHENEGTFQVVTPRSEVHVLNRAAHMDGPFLSVANSGGPVVVSVSSLDGNTLVDSRRILLIHLGNTIHEGTVFERNLVEEWGTQPRFVVSPNRPKVTLRFATSECAPQVWELDLSGKRIRSVPVDAGASLPLSFEVGYSGPGLPGFVYEILRA